MQALKLVHESSQFVPTFAFNTTIIGPSVPTLTLAEFQSIETLDFGTVAPGKSATTEFRMYHPGILPLDVSFTNIPADGSLSLAWHSLQLSSHAGFVALLSETCFETCMIIYIFLI